MWQGVSLRLTSLVTLCLVMIPKNDLHLTQMAPFLLATPQCFFPLVCCDCTETVLQARLWLNTLRRQQHPADPKQVNLISWPFLPRGKYKVNISPREFPASHSPRELNPSPPELFEKPCSTRGISGLWDCIVWDYNVDPRSVHICPKPSSGYHQE